MRSSWLNECLEQERREKKDEERVRSEKRTHVGGGFKYKISTDQRTIDCTVMTVAVRRTAAFQRVNRGPVERHAPKSEDNMDSNHCYPLPVTADGHPVRSSLFLVTIRDGSQAGDMNDEGVGTSNRLTPDSEREKKHIRGPRPVPGISWTVGSSDSGCGDKAEESDQDRLVKPAGSRLMTVRTRIPIKPAVRRQIISRFRTTFASQYRMSSSE